MEHDSKATTLNYETFRDLLSSALVERLSQPESKPRRRAKKSRARTRDAVAATVGGTPPRSPDHGPDPALSDSPPPASPRAEAPAPADLKALADAEHQLEREETNTAAEELADFIDYIATTTFAAFPDELASLEYYAWIASPAQQTKYGGPAWTGEKVAGVLPGIDPSVTESLVAYGALDLDKQSFSEVLAPILTDYVAACAAKPPPPKWTRTDACELCGRDWINLTYHHLIPRFVHEKVVKRGWHRREDLENVAWLCGACHRFVHHFAKHEDLARYYYTVELLLAQDEIQAFVKWVGRLRWKSNKTRY